MNGNVELLNYIHQNAEMGKDTIRQLIGITKDENFEAVLKEQLREYNEIFDASEEIIKELHKDAKGQNIISKGMAYLMIDMKTLRDKSSSHIAEMLIQGSTMGTIDMTKRIKEYNEGDSNILELATRLLKFEERNIEELKKFL